MEFKEDRQFATPEAAERKLLELANAVEPITLVAVAVINRQFRDAGGSFEEYGHRERPPWRWLDYTASIRCLPVVHASRGGFVPLGCQERRSRPKEKIEHEIAAPRHIQDSVGDKPRRLDRRMQGKILPPAATLAAIEHAREQHNAGLGGPRISAIVREIVEPGSVASALQPLRMARKLDPYRETAQIALEPWLVEAALARLDRRLSPADQRTIMRATRTPHRVRWPDWWSEHS
jgi:hypothetical protein